MAEIQPIPTRKSFQDLTGRVFGRLTVRAYAGPEQGRAHQLWICDCSCGKETVKRSNNLLTGHTTSCGCTQQEKFVAGAHFRHGGSHSPEWHAWQMMKSRCLKPQNKSFKDYGGRGIKICARWLECFDNFIADMGKRPSSKHSLDRFPDNNGNYEPGNCRWATRLEQMANKRTTRFLTVDGVTKPLCEWARHTGIALRTIWSRLKYGWSEHDAVLTPIGEQRKLQK